MNPLRETFRSLLHAPGFTLSVVVTLGLAIGANASIFTLIDQVIFRPLPVSHPDELVAVSAPPLPVKPDSGTKGMIMAGNKGRAGSAHLYGISYPNFNALRARMPMFHDMLAYSGLRANLQAGGEPVEVRGNFVTFNYFQMLGIRPALGRMLQAEDDRVPGGQAVAVLSHGFWQRRFGGDPSVLNRVIRLNDASLVVIGVAMAGFSGTAVGQNVDLFVPLEMTDQVAGIPGYPWDSPSMNVLQVMARLSPGQEREAAGKAANAIYRQMVAEGLAERGTLTPKDREYFAAATLALLPAGFAGDRQAGAARTLDSVLWLLMAMVAVVLLVAAGNVANLYVARGSARGRDTAIRLALGATRGRILRARFIESLTLALLSGAAGFLLSSWLVRLVPALLGLTEMPAGISGVPDWRVGLFAVAVATATGILTWAISAIQVTRSSSLPALSGSPREHALAGGMGLRRLMVLAQVGLSAALLCGCALLTRSLVGLMSVDPGFDTKNISAFTLTPAGKAYDAERTHALAVSLQEGARNLPGVIAASLATGLPLAGGSGGTWMTGDGAEPSSAAAEPVDIVEVGPAYFETLRLPVAAGREFTPADRTGAPKVAVINESLARRLFGQGPAVGRRIAYSQVLNPVFDMEVVGVARDVRSRSLRSAPPPTVYLPLLQATHAGGFNVVLRTAGAAPTMRDVKALVHREDPSLPVGTLRTMRDIVASGLARERLLAALSSAFGALAAALSAIGVIGLTGFSVTRRAPEIGVRLALGATRGRIMWLVLREVVVLGAAGGLFGIALYLGVSRYLQSVLFELSPNDPATILGAVMLLIAVALAAGWIPARRAARLDPAVTLRAE